MAAISNNEIIETNANKTEISEDIYNESKTIRQRHFGIASCRFYLQTKRADNL